MIHAAPNAYAIQEAQASIQLSVNEEAAKYKKDVEAAAKAIFEQAQREQLESDVAAATAALEEQIAKLKRDAAVAMAQLQEAAATELARLK
jgi:vacuolar-type H+-ATPase subunit E/Vma4